MEIKYDEEMERYYIQEDGQDFIDTIGDRMEWVDIEEAKKYMKNLDMVRLIYGNQ